MKNTKKFAAMIAALTLSACSIAPMAMTASAVAATTEFTMTADISADTSITNIKAVKIFDISISDDTKEEITVKDWAVDKDAQSALKSALGLSENATASDAATVLSGYTNNPAEAKAFAKAAAKALRGTPIKSETVANGAIGGTYAEGNVTFSESLAEGYYVVLCDLQGADNDSTVEGNKNYSTSLGMLTVTGRSGDTAIGIGNAKVGLPSVMKKVLEDDGTVPSYTATEVATLGALESAVNNDNSGTTDNKWNDGADWAIGQTKSFKLYGTLPANYDEYDTYYYEFHDSLATQFDKPEDSSFVVMIDGNKINASNYELTVTAGSGTTNHDISVKFDNLKDIERIDKDSVITVQYDTALNSTAVVGGNGQENEVYLTYSNNPNNSGAGNTDNGETPKDKVIVFTYALEFNKTFFEGTSELTDKEIFDGTYENLKFNLKDENGDKISVIPYVGTENYDYVIVDSDSTDANKTTDLELNLVSLDGSTISDETKATWKSKDDVPKGAKLVIRIKGLDSATYTIDETVPEGFAYNAVTGETVKIDTGVTYKQDWNDGAVSNIYSGIDYKFGKADEKNDVTSGTAEGTIENKKGSQLPSTGGMGTTIFYLGGGAMVAVAGVFLITKKRMGKSEN